jgi:hypothetical protein
VPDLDANIVDLQYAFVARPGTDQDILVESKYDIQTWEPRNINYRVVTEIKKSEITRDDFTKLRKKGLLKNRFVDITVDKISDVV